MSNHKGKSFKLGVFIVSGVAFLIALIFYVGSNQEIFGKRKKVMVVFKNVGGLKIGNPVRLSGVSIGRVDNIKIQYDSVKVILYVDEEEGSNIKKDSRVLIKTEGFMGIKYVSIEPGSRTAPSITENEIIIGSESPGINDLILTLTETGDNSKRIMEKINSGQGTLGALISDRSLLNQSEKVLATFEKTGHNTNELTVRMIQIAERSEVLTSKMTEVADTLKNAGYKAIQVSDNLILFTNKLNNDSSALGRFISDTTLADNMDKTLGRVNKAAQSIDVTSCEIRNHWFMRLFNKNKKTAKK